ncbi:ADP-ribose pyrophosphatase YjhB, NUDIX family [Actinokineospora alba]|uniref:ADP-ribose pyrophosphatase YjhB, NUDIX family n=1 Tax=Actinokineospora alba TaxID=504798 RepID=A0A1H0N6S5_9PSEU|nr:NUDIX hydrolase [Actinokineospora alba]TDP68593.1 ADP-ribose pyrophosphatase YjhB (NUDIX family) [Actinokineospora alba]SDH82467.1 ADP-ribose pyrophosphatase YjhB, NUDIX family [Actinokineospora alba]SDO88321.1 ADP-ribose pyrophosphatase YjhB, NUDIX family [Actinokineospora alba]
MARGDGDWVVRCERGHVHWGRFGAAGLLPVHDGHVLLQHRSRWTHGGGTWALFGGARDSHESAVEAALRETGEECTLDTSLVTPFGVIGVDHGNWSYETVIGSIDSMPTVERASRETRAAAWIPVDEVDRLNLYPPFAKAWTTLRTALVRPVLIVDAANVMGARADGWWKDRAGAAARLRDELAKVAAFPGITPFDVAFPEILFVVEGAARGIGSVDGITVVDAPGSGDDTIVDMARGRLDAPCLVITADRELLRRCEKVGAQVSGPRTLLSLLA